MLGGSDDKGSLAQSCTIGARPPAHISWVFKHIILLSSTRLLRGPESCIVQLVPSRTDAYTAFRASLRTGCRTDILTQYSYHHLSLSLHYPCQCCTTPTMPGHALPQTACHRIGSESQRVTATHPSPVPSEAEPRVVLAAVACKPFQGGVLTPVPIKDMKASGERPRFASSS
jgi:hypothetical protein